MNNLFAGAYGPMVETGKQRQRSEIISLSLSLFGGSIAMCKMHAENK